METFIFQLQYKPIVTQIYRIKYDYRTVTQLIIVTEIVGSNKLTALTTGHCKA